MNFKSTATVAILLLGISQLHAAPRKIFIPRNDAGFGIVIDVNHKDRVYHEGDHLVVSAKAAKSSYLYIFNISEEGDTYLLFPSENQPNNYIEANQTVTIPERNSGVVFETSPPFGSEQLVVVATLEPVKEIGQIQLEKGGATPINKSTSKVFREKVKERVEKTWAEARIDVRTLPNGNKPRAQKKAAVCIGISNYRDDSIRNLSVSHKDASTMAVALQRYCHVDASNIELLQDSLATRAAIEKALFNNLVERTEPGDTVYIYFSGHGGRTADTNQDEEDGLDEYLVPHDGVLGNTDSMILDDTFARWMQELDGRKIIIILDNCHSGGSSKGIKGLMGKSGKPVFAKTLNPLDMVDNDFNRSWKLSKDLTQPQTVVFAASQADQLAWEMPDGRGSAFTFYFVDVLSSTGIDDNNNGKIEAAELFGHLKERVADYVREEFKTEQTPVLFDNSNGNIFVLP